MTDKGEFSIEFRPIGPAIPVPLTSEEIALSIYGLAVSSRLLGQAGNFEDADLCAKVAFRMQEYAEAAFSEEWRAFGGDSLFLRWRRRFKRITVALWPQGSS